MHIITSKYLDYLLFNLAESRRGGGEISPTLGVFLLRPDPHYINVWDAVLSPRSPVSSVGRFPFYFVLFFSQKVFAVGSRGA